MITLSEYFGKWLTHEDATAERKANATKLLVRVSELMDLAISDGVRFQVNPNTNSQVAGQQYGGFRPQSCTQGAAKSSHKEGLAIDLFDPDNDIDRWMLAHQPHLETCGIFIEHPESTPHWAHLTIKAPGSGRRVFMP